MKVIIEAQRKENNRVIVLGQCPARCPCPGCPGKRPNH